jgi:hypothetical protein
MFWGEKGKRGKGEKDLKDLATKVLGFFLFPFSPLRLLTLTLMLVYTVNGL